MWPESFTSGCGTCSLGHKTRFLRSAALREKVLETWKGSVTVLPWKTAMIKRLPAPLWALVIAGHQAVLAWTVWKGGFSCSRSQLLKRQLHVFNRAIWDEGLYILFTSASHWDLLLSLSWRAQDPICKQDLGWPAEVVKSSPSVIFRADVSKLYPRDQMQHASYFYE